MVGTEYLNVGHHVVQFYGRDAELGRRVSDYLLDALNGGGAVIVIATPGHRRDFAERLTGTGVDLAAARQGGVYLEADAAEMIGRLKGAGQLDGAAFGREIGGLICRAADGGRPVRAYSEMVALLWDDGLVNAAAQLEAMWDELSRRHTFSLFCGYRSGAGTGESQLDAFAEVCRLHQQIIGLSGAAPGHGVPGVARTFALSRDAPAAARRFAAGTLSGWGAGDLADDAALVVTELAANAVVHARSEFTVILSARRGLIRISVRDASPLPAEGAAAPAPAPLHGLFAVDALAGRWGIDGHGGAGKTVWVELRR